MAQEKLDLDIVLDINNADKYLQDLTSNLASVLKAVTKLQPAMASVFEKGTQQIKGEITATTTLMKQFTQLVNQVEGFQRAVAKLDRDANKARIEAEKAQEKAVAQRQRQEGRVQGNWDAAAFKQRQAQMAEETRQEKAMLASRLRVHKYEINLAEQAAKANMALDNARLRAQEKAVAQRQAQERKVQAAWDAAAFKQRQAQVAEETRRIRAEARAQEQAYRASPEYAAKHLNRLAGSTEYLRASGGLQLARLMANPARVVAGAAIGSPLFTLGASIGAIPSNTVASVMEYQVALADLKAISGATADEMARMQKSISDTGASSKFSLTQITEATTTLAQSGLSPEQIDKSINAINKMAMATGSDLATSISIATDAMTAFGFKAEDIDSVADKVSKVLNDTRLGAEQIRTGFQYVAPSAAQFKIPMEEVLALMANLTEAGIKAGSMLGTTLNQLIQDINHAASDNKIGRMFHSLGLTKGDVDIGKLGLAKVIQNLRDAGLTADKAMQIFDVRAYRAYAANYDRMDLFAKNFRGMTEDFQGAAERAAHEVENTLPAALTSLKNQLVATTEGGVKPFSDALVNLTHGATDVVKYVVDPLITGLGKLFSFLAAHTNDLAPLAALVGLTNPLTMPLSASYLLTRMGGEIYTGMQQGAANREIQQSKQQMDALSASNGALNKYSPAQRDAFFASVAKEQAFQQANSTPQLDAQVRGALVGTEHAGMDISGLTAAGKRELLNKLAADKADNSFAPGVTPGQTREAIATAQERVRYAIQQIDAKAAQDMYGLQSQQAHYSAILSESSSPTGALYGKYNDQQQYMFQKKQQELQKQTLARQLATYRAQAGAYAPEIAAAEAELAKAGGTGTSKGIQAQRTLNELRAEQAELTQKAAEAEAELKARSGEVVETQDDLITQLKQLAQQWQEQSEVQSQWGYNLRTNFFEVVNNGKAAFGEFTSSVVNGTASISEAFKTMAVNILQSLQKIATDKIAEQIFGGLSGVFGSALSGLFGGNSPGVSSTGVGTAVSYAPTPILRNSGGYIPKANNGMYLGRDSQLVYAQPGEYVMRRSAVSLIGKENLDQLNAMGNRQIANTQGALSGMTSQGVATPQITNVYVVAPEQKPSLTANDVLVTISNDILKGGTTKKLIKSVVSGA